MAMRADAVVAARDAAVPARRVADRGRRWPAPASPRSRCVGAPTDPVLAPIAIFAVAAAELLTLDFPDRRGVSVAALPVLLAAAAGGDAAAVWAAALGTAAGQPRPPPPDRADPLPVRPGRAGRPGRRRGRPP